MGRVIVQMAAESGAGWAGWLVLGVLVVAAVGVLILLGGVALDFWRWLRRSSGRATRDRR